MRHLMSPLDFSVEELDKLLDLANDIEANPQKYAHKCEGKKLATCFYEPSTRTRLSFEAAMLNLGGSVLGFHSADSSSASKGESVADTIRIISCYADICAMRHPKEGAPLVASQKSRIPVINAGDGGHQHPTQTLADLLTIRSLKGRLDNITIGLCGDLKFGRTVHSLINAMIRYKNVKFVLISPEELKIPDYVRDDVLRANGIEFEEVEKLEDAMDKLDVLYMTRVQKERFLEAGFSVETAIRMMNSAMVMKGADDLYSTVDLCKINLYTGMAKLYKIGAAATFIKRGAEVECITSQSLPVGAQVQMDISVQETKLTGGDFVVMVTDGVLEYLHVKKPEDTMQEIIESIQTNNPGILAKKIMERVMLFTGGKAKDDMTVLAACIWEK